MKETRVDGTQADGTPVKDADEAQVADDEVGDDDGVDVEILRRARLRAMLGELVRHEGPTKAAELLGVNYKTVARAERSGRVTGRMSDALERLLGPVDDPELSRQRERIGALEESVQRLEGGMESLARELRDSLDGVRAAVAGQAEAQEATDGEGAGRSETRAAPPVSGLGAKKPFRERRLDPEIVTAGTRRGRSPRSTALRGRWWRSGEGCGPVTPARAGACRGS